MIWSLIGSVGVGTVGWVLYAFTLAGKASAEKDAALQHAQAESAQRERYEFEDKAARLEKVIVQQQEELRELNEDLSMCDVPGTIRDRLNRLSTRLTGSNT